MKFLTSAIPNFKGFPIVGELLKREHFIFGKVVEFNSGKNLAINPTGMSFGSKAHKYIWSFLIFLY